VYVCLDDHTHIHLDTQSESDTQSEWRTCVLCTCVFMTTHTYIQTHNMKDTGAHQKRSCGAVSFDCTHSDDAAPRFLFKSGDTVAHHKSSAHGFDDMHESRLTHNESCLTYECTMSHTNETCLTHGCIISHVRRSHVSHMSHVQSNDAAAHNNSCAHGCTNTDHSFALSSFSVAFPHCSPATPASSAPPFSRVESTVEK